MRTLPPFDPAAFAEASFHGRCRRYLFDRPPETAPRAPFPEEAPSNRQEPDSLPLPWESVLERRG